MMVDKKRKVPNLRFKGLTNDWVQRKLGEIAIRVQGNDGRMNLPTLTISAGNGWMDQRDRFSQNIAGKEQKNYTLLRQGELSYNHGNSKLAQFGAVFELESYNEALVPRVYHSFSVTAGAQPKFIEQMFATHRPDRELRKLVSSGARMDGLLNINYDDFMGIKVWLPSVAEQQAIAGLLVKLDNTIALQQRKLDLLKEQKKGYLQKMFPKNGAKVPELRFAGFADNWEQRKLGEVAEIVGGGTPSTKVKEYWDGDINWYSPVEIGNSIYASGSAKRITKLGLEKSSAKILPKGTVLFTSRAGIGNTAILSKEAATNQGFQSIVPKKKLLDSYFIFTETPFLKKYGEINGAGSTFVEVSGKQMAKMPLRLPLLEEQKKIGGFFKQIDTLIALHQRKLDLLKEQKKVFLQKMFV